MELINSIYAKKCSNCKEIKSLTEFHKGSKECKPCKYQRYITDKYKYFPKINCSCGRIVFKHVLKEHLDSRVHKRLTEVSFYPDINMIAVN